ncbi:MAS20 protein import receptor-domain-containing protein [Gaertneriomyces semiglobifer]|nr:MAS20 protein import receptor-domain-containing protein [Gaertneriomyces semiglobifer]
MVSTRDVVVGAAVAAAVGIVGYAVYFDQKRQRDPAFRRNLRKQRKQAAAAKHAEAAASRQKPQPAAAKAGMPSMASFDPDEPVPTNPQARGEFFMKHLQLGEALVARGPQAYEVAAQCFFKALQAYSDPMNLLMALQQSMPEPVMNLIMELFAADLRKHNQQYFEHFPPTELNVKVKEVVQGITPEGKRIVRRGLTVTKDYAAGETVYAESPLVAIPRPDLHEFCSHCLKPLVDKVDAVTCEKCDKERFCSSSCRDAGTVEYHNMLCVQNEQTGEASAALLQHCLDCATVYPLMVAKFLARMVHDEMSKKPTTADSNYSTWDHLERLYDLKGKATEGDLKVLEMIKNIIAPQVPGFTEFLTEERYMTIKNKIAYNSYATASDSAVPALKGDEVIRGAYPDDTKSGVGLYHATSWISHSCAPNVEIQFFGCTDKVSIVAKQDLKNGDELVVSYMNVDGLTTSERRKKLKSKFAFHCKCALCKGSSAEATDAPESAEVADSTGAASTAEVTETISITETVETTTIGSGAALEVTEITETVTTVESTEISV